MTSDQGKPQSNRRVLAIADAARELGVSERTIYRMIRSGKIERVKVSDKNASVVIDNSNCVKEISCVENNSILMEVNVGLLSDKLSDNVSASLSRLIQHEIEVRDRQIETLMEQHRELHVTISRLQEQVCELAKLVVVAEKNSDLAVKKIENQPTKRSLRGLFGLMRGRR